MTAPLRLLIAEDEPELRDLMVTGLAHSGFVISAARDGEQALGALAEQEFDIVVLDAGMPKRSGIEVLQQMRSGGDDAQVIMLTAPAEVAIAIEAVKLEAVDYITKPFPLTALAEAVERAAETRRLRRENRLLRRAVAQREPPATFHGQSPAIERVRGLLERAGRSESHVLILGESGSGKELAARVIHGESPRRALPFLTMNCASELLESELFGHEGGALTDAAERRHGLLELAHEGTLFLHEVGEMSLPVQAKLLRAIDGGEIRRMGGERALHVDVRIVAATGQDLGRAVARGEFRADLYYRLSVVVVRMPALRERVEDIPLLAEHFARLVAPPGRRPIKLTTEAMSVLTAHAWPGNVRELRDLIERLTVPAATEEITAADVALHVPTPAGEPEGALLSLAEIERQHILTVMRRAGQNRARAAKILGVDPKTLYNKLKSYGAD